MLNWLVKVRPLVALLFKYKLKISIYFFIILKMYKLIIEFLIKVLKF